MKFNIPIKTTLSQFDALLNPEQREMIELTIDAMVNGEVVRFIDDDGVRFRDEESISPKEGKEKTLTEHWEIKSEPNQTEAEK